jgi:ribosome-associated protein
VTDQNNETTDQVKDKEAVAADPRACALIAARAADKKKATDIIVQEVGKISDVTEYFVIVTAANNRQVDAIIDEIEEQLRLEAGIKPSHREDSKDGSWELLDYGTFVVHVFQPETREFYRLEALWNDAPVIDLAKEAGLDDVEYSDRIAKMLDGKLKHKGNAAGSKDEAE